MKPVNWQEFVLFFIAMGSPLAFFVSILQVLKYRHEFRLTMLAVTCLVAALVIMRMYFFAASLHNAYYLFMIPGLVSAILAAGPMAMGQLRQMLDFCLPPRRVATRYLVIPSLLMLVVELVLVSLFHEKARVLVQDTFDNYRGVGYYLLLLSVLHLVSHFFVILWHLKKLRFQVAIRHGQMLFYLLFVPVSALVMVILGYGMQLMPLFQLGMILITITMLIIIGMMVLFPGFFESLEEQVKSRYAQTPLTGIDIEYTKKNLAALVQAEEIYRDSELRLSHVAERLKISTNQLSRILNEHFSQTFNEFINQYRIEEARRCLERGEAASILKLAYEVGFNSKSTFNKQFKKATGLTPKEYRQRALKEMQ